MTAGIFAVMGVAVLSPCKSRAAAVTIVNRRRDGTRHLTLPRRHDIHGA